MCDESTAVAKASKAFVKDLRTFGVSDDTAHAAAAERFGWALIGQVDVLEARGIRRATACARVACRFGLDGEWLDDWLFTRALARAGLVEASA